MTPPANLRYINARAAIEHEPGLADIAERRERAYADSRGALVPMRRERREPGNGAA